MLRLLCSAFLFAIVNFFSNAFAQDCQRLRFAEIGWTDGAVVTALAQKIFQDLGYQTTSTQLSLPVSFRAMKDGDIDIFLSYWQPSMDAEIKSYLSVGDIEVSHPVLRDAKYTLAVPAYMAEKGLQSFHDLQAYRDQLGGKIYGLEPGNDGNRLIQMMLNQGAFHLRNWTLVESSEQAMLAEVIQANTMQTPIVFLGWAPHPMNRKLKIKFLQDGDAYFGANQGAAEVLATMRRGLRKACPEVAQVLGRLSFTVDDVNELMEMVLDHEQTPDQAAQAWLLAHPERWQSFTLKAPSGFSQSSSHELWSHRIRLGEWLTKSGSQVFGPAVSPLRSLSKRLNYSVETVVLGLLGASPLVLIAGLSLASWLVSRRLMLGICCLLGLYLILALGYWKEAIETLVMVSMASVLSLVMGLPIGILAAKKAGFYQLLRPLLDIMQTVPTFVYLIPALMLFGLGFSPGLLATLIFVLPVPIRMSYLGISSVPVGLRELGSAFGASSWQSLVKIEIPYAWPTIRNGMSQSFLLALSMVVISALVGADGLGKPVVQALNTVDMAKGIEAGLAIVILAILVDRIVQPSKSQRIH